MARPLLLHEMDDPLNRGKKGWAQTSVWLRHFSPGQVFPPKSFTKFPTFKIQQAKSQLLGASLTAEHHLVFTVFFPGSGRHFKNATEPVLHGLTTTVKAQGKQNKRQWLDRYFCTRWTTPSTGPDKQGLGRRASDRRPAGTSPARGRRGLQATEVPRATRGPRRRNVMQFMTRRGTAQPRQARGTGRRGPRRTRQAGTPTARARNTGSQPHSAGPDT